jgi:DegV family protein with EDD domain
MNIALVTDSTADIPETLVAKHQIHVIPNVLMLDGKSYEDGKTMTREQFYRLLPGLSTLPTTATASSGVYQVLYQKLLHTGYEAVVSIHASSRLSGIFSAASTAAAEFGDQVQVLDSESLTLGMGFQVLAAAEAIARRVHLAELLDLLADIRHRVRVIAMLDTLEYVRRSGRVSWARARLGNFLQIKPFVQVVEDGKVLSMGETRTRTKGIQRLKGLLQDLGELEWLAVLHTNAEADALEFLASLDHHPPHEILVVNVTPVIGTHVGPNGLGIAAVVK